MRWSEPEPQRPEVGEGGRSPLFGFNPLIMLTRGPSRLSYGEAGRRPVPAGLCDSKHPPFFVVVGWVVRRVPRPPAVAPRPPARRPLHRAPASTTQPDNRTCLPTALASLRSPRWRARSRATSSMAPIKRSSRPSRRGVEPPAWRRMTRTRSRRCAPEQAAAASRSLPIARPAPPPPPLPARPTRHAAHFTGADEFGGDAQGGRAEEVGVGRQS